MPKLDPNQVAYDLEHAASAVDLSVSTLRKEVQDRWLKAKKFGRSYLIGAVELRAWFERLPDAD